MSKPIPGSTYTVKKDDSLSLIAEKAYGDSQQWPLIYSANQKRLKSNDPNLVYPGEVLLIPERPEVRDALDSIQKKSNVVDDLQIEVGGRRLTVIAAKIIRTMDTAADAWSATIAWEPGKDQEIDRVTAPFSYEKSKAYILGEEQVTGPIMEVKPVINADGSQKMLVGYSATINIVDSDLKPDDYEDNNISLKERAEKLLKPYGLRVYTDQFSGEKANEKFDRVSAEDNVKIFQHLAKLAKQKQVLISSTPKGNLLLTRANVNAVPVGTIEEAKGIGLEYSAKFDGRKRFSVWKVDCQTPFKKNKKNGISKDNAVPFMRFRNITVDNDTEGGIEETADWIRSKEFIEALSIPFPYPSFRSPNGEIWKENTTVIVKSPTIGVPNGFKFLITKVEFKRDNDGDGVVLSLVPPQVYTGEVIDEPWRV